jgi:DNA-binding HxlR family transcriptional regulator
MIVSPRKYDPEGYRSRIPAMPKTAFCPTETTLDLIAGRWKVLVIWWLLRGEKRFNQLQRDLKGITHRTLARQLKEMEADGLVARRDFGEIPPRVEYSLTALGRSLEPVLMAMDEWAQKNARARRSKS